MTTTTVVIGCFKDLLKYSNRLIVRKNKKRLEEYYFLT